MCGYFCIGFIDLMLSRKKVFTDLTDFTDLFTQNNFEKSDDIILNCFITNI